MSIELRVKAMSLAAESKIIRKEEVKFRKTSRWYRGRQDLSRAEKSMRTYNSLRDHRIHVVRREARATELARAFLEALPYKYIEQARRPEKEYEFTTYIVPRVVDMVNKYGPVKTTRESVLEWAKLE